MDVTPLIRSQTHIIHSYKNGQYKIAGAIYTGTLLITEDEIIECAPVTIESVTPALFESLKQKPEIILCGLQGAVMPLSPARRDEFRGAGFSIDLMDIGSACRTYNVLVAEGRSVAALLI